MSPRETSIMNNLNCKMQVHVRVCKENKLLELEEKCLLNNFVVKGESLKDHIGRVGDISKRCSQG